MIPQWGNNLYANVNQFEQFQLVTSHFVWENYSIGTNPHDKVAAGVSKLICLANLIQFHL